MALMMASLYDALKAANVDDDKARKAAEEVAGYESQLADLRSSIKLQTWMLTFSIALGVANLFATFSVVRAIGS